MYMLPHYLCPHVILFSWSCYSMHQDSLEISQFPLRIPTKHSSHVRFGLRTRRTYSVQRMARSQRTSGCRGLCTSFVILMQLLMPKVVAQTLTNETSFTPATGIYINCGGDNATVAGQGFFSSDINSSYASDGILASNSARNVNDPMPELLENARVFWNTSTYTIPVVGIGQVWLRLWFYPITFVESPQLTVDPTNTLFSVSANEFTLLSNLSTAEMQPAGKLFLFREYVINVTTGELVVTFEPAPNAVAYVNGLAVQSVPEDLLQSTLTDIPSTLSVPTIPVLGKAFETMYRLNIGGDVVVPNSDSFLYRQWDLDSIFLYPVAVIGVAAGLVNPSEIVYPDGVPAWTAPQSVYATARMFGGAPSASEILNLTWVFDVDPGFDYYVRLHFAEIIYSSINERVFDIFLNNETAYKSYDCIAASSGLADGASFLDFFVGKASFDGVTGDELWVSLQPSSPTTASHDDVILNGLEIFKISSVSGSLVDRSSSLAPEQSLN